MMHLVLRLMLLGALTSFLLSSAALADPPPVSEPVSEPMPEILYWDSLKVEPPPILFVSAEKAFLANGELNTALVRENTVAHLETSIQNLEPGQCIPGTQWTHSLPSKHWGGFQSIAADSDFVVLTKVKGTQKGVAGFDLGTLFLVEAQRWLKGESLWDEMYFFIPSAEMKIAGRQICSFDERYPELPEVGWQVIISFQSSFNRARPILAISPPQLIVLPPSGKVLLPKRLKRFQSDWLEKTGPEVLRSVEQKLIENPR